MFSPPAVSRALLAALVVSLAASQARAQVTVNPRALDQLAPPATTTPAPTPKPATPKPAAPVRKPQRPPAPPDGPHHTLPPLGQVPVPAGTAAGKPGAPQKPAPVTVPAVPPPAPVLPPPIVVPTRPAPPPPPAPVAADAPGAFSKIPAGLRVTFGTDRADLNPDTLAALRTLAHAASPGFDTSFSVTAYAAGSPDDPSSARRLSLSRALTVRSVLINEGVPSMRIYVRALGASAPTIADGPPDRADVTIANGAPAAPAPMPAPAASPAGPPTAMPQKAAP